MKNKGFTLLELLVVIAIIGILASVVVASLSKARISGRDTARFQQATEFVKALELYHTENGAYPNDNSLIPVQFSVIQSQFPQYLSRVPADPVFTANQTYLYCSSADLRTMTIILMTEKTGAGSDPNVCALSRGPDEYTNICPGIGGYESCTERILQ